MTGDTAGAQRANGVGIAQAMNGGIATVNLTVAEGAVANSVLLQLIEKLGEERDATWQSKLETLTVQLSATQDAVEGFLVTMQRRGVPPDKYASTLQEIAADFHKLTQRDRFGKDFAEDVEKLIEAANERLLRAKTEVDYLDADDKLLQAETLVRDSIRQRKVALDEQRKLLDDQMREAAQLSARRALVARVMLRYGDAAEHFVSAAETLEGTRFHEDEIEYYFDAGRALHMGGERQGNSALLARGVEVFKKLIELCTKYSSSELAEAFIGWGGCLALIGERNNGPVTELNSALEAFKHVLSLEGVDPRLVSMTRNNIANVLFHLAKRAPTDEARDYVATAVQELKSALADIDKENDPHGWALIAFNKASQTLAGRESPSVYENEMKLLDEVARIYSSDKRFKPEWAATQVSKTIGHRYFIFHHFSLGSVEQALEHGRAAESLIKQAQSVWTEADFPSDWAMAEMNLGSIQSIVSQLTEDQGKANLAADSLSRASATYALLGNKVGWAGAQHNLGLHFFTNALWARAPELFRQAIPALENALTVYLPAEFPDSYENSKDIRRQAIERLAAAENS